MNFASNLGAKEVLHLMKTASKIGAKNLHRDDFCVKIGCKRGFAYNENCIKNWCKKSVQTNFVSQLGAKEVLHTCQF